MSFRITYSDVIIANRALGMLPEAPIDNLDGPGVARRALRTYYKPTIAALLSKHDFGMATRRVALAAQTNDRPEWLYKYAAPNDLGYAVTQHAMLGSSGGVGYYEGLKAISAGGYAKFKRVGNAIYSNMPGAILEYTSLDVTEADFSEAFVDIVVPTLASAIAMDITKRDDLRDTLAAMGRAKLNEWLAVERNQRGERYGDAMTETEIVRQVGIGGAFELGGFPLDPVRGY